MDKRNILTLLATIVVVMLIGGLVSCDDNDDNSNNGIVGTWVGYGCADSNPNDLDMSLKLTLVLYSDGSGKYLLQEASHGRTEGFVYNMDSSTRGKTYIHLIGNYIYFEIVKNKMYVYGHGYGDDLDYLLTKQ